MLTTIELCVIIILWHVMRATCKDYFD